MKNKLNFTQILNKAGAKYVQLKLAKHGMADYMPEIKSDQLKAVLETLVEEINKILDEK